MPHTHTNKKHQKKKKSNALLRNPKLLGHHIGFLVFELEMFNLYYKIFPNKYHGTTGYE
jgi:hypothetical protein